MDKNYYLIELSESPKTDFGKRDFADQRDEQQVFSAIWELESQVNGGGFRGYLGNVGNQAPTGSKQHHRGRQQRAEEER